jgi:hypothetical protein
MTIGHRTVMPPRQDLLHVLDGLEAGDREVLRHLQVLRSSPAGTAEEPGIRVEEVHRRACRATKPLSDAYRESAQGQGPPRSVGPRKRRAASASGRNEEGTDRLEERSGLFLSVCCRSPWVGPSRKPSRGRPCRRWSSARARSSARRSVAAVPEFLDVGVFME